MKRILLLLILILAPFNNVSATTFTDADAQRQLTLEATNLASFGNPFGKTGKFEELYDATGKPWWMIQLDKEAWSMETYGNPFGYFIPQKVFNAPTPNLLTYITPIQPQVSIVSPSPAKSTSTSLVPEPTLPIEYYFLSAPYLTPDKPATNGNPITERIAVQFSQPLLDPDTQQTKYQFYCITTQSPLGIRFKTYPYNTQDKSFRGVDILADNTVNGIGRGHYNCRFKFTDPVIANSEEIEFDM